MLANFKPHVDIKNISSFFTMLYNVITKRLFRNDKQGRKNEEWFSCHIIKKIVQQLTLESKITHERFFESKRNSSSIRFWFTSFTAVRVTKKYIARSKSTWTIPTYIDHCKSVLFYVSRIPINILLLFFLSFSWLTHPSSSLITGTSRM